MTEELKIKLIKIGKGAAIAAIAAGLTTGAQLLLQTDFGPNGKVLAMFVASVLTNAVKVLASL